MKEGREDLLYGRRGGMKVSHIEMSYIEEEEKMNHVEIREDQ